MKIEANIKRIEQLDDEQYGLLKRRLSVIERKLDDVFLVLTARDAADIEEIRARIHAQGERLETATKQSAPAELPADAK